MNLKQTATWNKGFGKIGTLLCVLLLLAILDGLISRFREPTNHFSCLPGSRIAVSGPLTEKIENPRNLAYQSNSQEIRLVFEAVQTGFWMGGYMWNGILDIDPGIQPGGYTLIVQTPKRTRGQPGAPFHVEVYRDQTQWNQNSKSIFRRTLGINPWRAALFIIPFILLVFGLVFFLSHKMEILLADQGKAEVYRVRKSKDGYEIFFGLGSKQGINPGTSLTLIDKQGGVIGSLTPQEIFESHSIARVGLESTVQPGFMIRR
jgi:hypothetical protein